MTVDNLSMPSPTDRPGGRMFSLTSGEMDQHECRALLAVESVGRVGWTSGQESFILPVSYVLRGDRIAFRTSPYGTLARLVTPTNVAFQIDELDRPRRAGRCVLAQGVSQGARPTAWEPVWRMDDVTPWASGTRNLFIEIHIQQLSGRTFQARR